MLDPTLREGVRGTWFYHYSKSGVALCGANTMPTGVRSETWGARTHLHERYCSKCAELAAKAEGPQGEKS